MTYKQSAILKYLHDINVPATIKQIEEHIDQNSAEGSLKGLLDRSYVVKGKIDEFNSYKINPQMRKKIQEIILGL